MQPDPQQAPGGASARRRRRRAVGPPGAAAGGLEPRLEPSDEPAPTDDDERLLRDRPPHHDQGV